MAKIIKLIYTEERVGLGGDNDPVRKCPQLWTLDGKLLAEADSDIDVSKFYIENLEP